MLRNFPKASIYDPALTSIIQIVYKQERLTVIGVARKHVVKIFALTTRINAKDFVDRSLALTAVSQ